MPIGADQFYIDYSLYSMTQLFFANFVKLHKKNPPIKITPIRQSASFRAFVACWLIFVSAQVADLILLPNSLLAFIKFDNLHVT